MTEETKHYKYGGSVVERISLCSASAHAPRLGISSNAAERGTRIHNMFEEILTGRGRREEGWSDGEWHTAQLAAKAARDLLAEYGMQDNYLCEYEVTCPDIHPDAGGTADILAWKPFGDMLCLDLKTGFQYVEAEDNLQPLFYSMCATKTAIDAFTLGTLKDCHMVILQIVDDEVSIRTWTLPVSEVIASDAKFREIIVTAEVNPTYVPGEHCLGKYCDAATDCVAFKAYTDDLAGGKFYAALEGKKVEPSQKAAELAKELAAIKIMEKYITAVKQRCMAEAKANPSLWASLGWEVSTGVGHRKWCNDKDTITALKRSGLKLDEIAPRQLITPAKLETMALEKGLELDLEALVFKPPTAASLKKCKKTKDLADAFLAAAN